MLASQVGKAIGKALVPLTGGVGKELSGYLADQIRFLRWKSAIKILERAKVFCGKKKIRAQNVPIKFIVPFLEAASFEDVEIDQTLCDMWSALFASAVTSYQARHAVYIDILKKLSSSDAAYIDKFYRKLMGEKFYIDSGFDPDLWNVNDKQEFMEDFNEAFQVSGKEILSDWARHESHSTIDKYDVLIGKCARANSWRLDFIPLMFDLSFYNEDGPKSSMSGPFKAKRGQLESTTNLIALGLMEKFEIVSWYPEKHRKGFCAVRVTAAFAIRLVLIL